MLRRSEAQTRIVPPKSASNTLKDSSNKREQKGGHLLTKWNYIVKRDTPERETCVQVSVCEREKEKVHETDREKDCKGLWIWQVVTDDPSGGVVCVCVADGMKGQDVSSEQSCQHHREQDSRHVHVVKRERLKVREINVH